MSECRARLAQMLRCPAPIALVLRTCTILPHVCKDCVLALGFRFLASARLARRRRRWMPMRYMSSRSCLSLPPSECKGLWRRYLGFAGGLMHNTFLAWPHLSISVSLGPNSTRTRFRSSAPFAHCSVCVRGAGLGCSCAAALPSRCCQLRP